MSKYLFLFGLLASIIPGAGFAGIPSDQHVQSDRVYCPNLDMNSEYVSGSIQLRHFRSMLEDEYPLRSIYLNASAQRLINISDTAYLLTLSQPERAREFYSVAVDLLPSLPGWSCGTDPDLDIRYPIYYPASNLGDNPRLSEVVTRFFEQGTQVGFNDPDSDRSSYPDIAKKQFHFEADVDELIEMARAEIESSGMDNWWYQPGKQNSLPGEEGMPIFVSLYKFDRSFVVDATLEQLENMKSAGIIKAPVIIVYNNSYALPITQECKNIEGVNGATDSAAALSELLTIKTVASSYFDCRRKVTPPREWHKGDYHILASLEEIASTIGYPAKKEVNPQEWKEMEADLSANGFHPPMLITLNQDDGMVWANDRTKAAVAASMGIERIPVVFLFHDFLRDRCDAVPNCGPAICRAVVAGGADFNQQQCNDVYQEWLRQKRGLNVNQASDGKNATIDSDSRETTEILKKAAEQIQ